MLPMLLNAGLVLLIFLGTSGCTIAWTPDSRRSAAPVITPVNDWLYRGSQPREDDLNALKRKGIRTLVNFRTEPKWIGWEKKKVEALGMNYVGLPWDLTQSVGPELLDQFFAVLDRPENRPVYMHCRHGRNRVGVMTTLALMRYENRSEAEAREEALETIRPQLLLRASVDEKIAFFNGTGSLRDRYPKQR